MHCNFYFCKYFWVASVQRETFSSQRPHDRHAMSAPKPIFPRDISSSTTRRLILVWEIRFRHDFVTIMTEWLLSSDAFTSRPFRRFSPMTEK